LFFASLCGIVFGFADSYLAVCRVTEKEG